MILCKEEYAKAIDKAIFRVFKGGPLMHVIAGKAVCLGEALKPEFKEYGKSSGKRAGFGKRFDQTRRKIGIRRNR